MHLKRRWILRFYDLVIFLLSALFILVIYPSHIDRLTFGQAAAYAGVGLLCVFIARLILKVYDQIWRYAGPKEYIGLILADGMACLTFVLIRVFFPHVITFVRAVSLFTLNLLACIARRLFYQWIYQNRSSRS